MVLESREHFCYHRKSYQTVQPWTLFTVRLEKYYYRRCGLWVSQVMWFQGGGNHGLKLRSEGAVGTTMSA